MPFWSKSVKCPIPEEDRIWLHDSLAWLSSVLGSDYIKTHQTLSPIVFQKELALLSAENVNPLIAKVGQISGVKTENIEVRIFEETSQIRLDENLYSTGIGSRTLGTFQLTEDGRYEIHLEKRQLIQPHSLIATIAHEMAHFVLLEHDVMDFDNEELVDLMTIVAGFGLFTANTAIPKLDTWSEATGSAWKFTGGEGYLPFELQAYSLAWLDHQRDDRQSEWQAYLDKEVLKIYNNARKFLAQNPET